MPRSRSGFKVGKVMLIVAGLALPMGWLEVSEAQRRARCLEIADRLKAMAQAYRGQDQTFLPSRRLAEWNEHLQEVFEDAASRPWGPVPKAPPFPPPEFRASDSKPLASSAPKREKDGD